MIFFAIKNKKIPNMSKKIVIKILFKIVKFCYKNRSEIILLLLKSGPVERFVHIYFLKKKLILLYFIYKKRENETKKLKLIMYYQHLLELQKVCLPW